MPLAKYNYIVQAIPVCTENSNTHIVMMKPAEDGVCGGSFQGNASVIWRAIHSAVSFTAR